MFMDCIKERGIKMNEINGVEKIFLGRLESLLSKFDEIDSIVNDIEEMIEEHPKKQSESDLLLSDYYHRLENENLTDTEILNIGKKIHDARIYRRKLNRANALMGCYTKHKEKIRYSVRANREMFRNAIKKTNDTLYEDYQYRILTDNDFKNLKTNENIKKHVTTISKEHKKRGKGITKEQIEEYVKEGMGTVAIANKFNVKAPYISFLKKKYGLNKKD